MRGVMEKVNVNGVEMDRLKENFDEFIYKRCEKKRFEVVGKGIFNDDYILLKSKLSDDDLQILDAFCDSVFEILQSTEIEAYKCAFFEGVVCSRSMD